MSRASVSLTLLTSQVARIEVPSLHILLFGHQPLLLEDTIVQQLPGRLYKVDILSFWLPILDLSRSVFVFQKKETNRVDMAKVFRKCKSATFQIGGDTYTIGKFAN